MGRVRKLKINSALVLAATAALLMLVPTSSWAQDSRRTLAVTGEIGGSEATADLQVELRGDDVQFDAARVFVSSSGEFAFPRVKTGQYELLVTDLSGDVVHHEYVTVRQGMGFLRVRLPHKTAAQVPTGTVSVAQLQRKVPRRAVKEYHASLADIDKGDTKQAINHLARALEAAPDYMEAHNELGVCVLREQRLEEAAEEFQTAAHLDPGAPAPAANLSAALYLLKRFSEAEVAARHALRLNPALTKARYVLGMSLHAERQFSKEMLGDLKRVADQFPQARLAMADALVQLGRKGEAALQLKQYLLQPSGTQERHAVEAWLADLNAGGDARAFSDRP